MTDRHMDISYKAYTTWPKQMPPGVGLPLTLIMACILLSTVHFQQDILLWESWTIVDSLLWTLKNDPVREGKNN